MTTIYAHKLLYLRKVGGPQRIATNQRWLDHRRVRRFFQGYHPQQMAKSAGGDGTVPCCLLPRPETGDTPVQKFPEMRTRFVNEAFARPVDALPAHADETSYS
jgi:hypothetical protein